MKKFLLFSVLLSYGLLLAENGRADALDDRILSFQADLRNLPSSRYDSLFSAVLPVWSQQTDSAMHRQLVGKLIVHAKQAGDQHTQAALLYASGWFYRHLIANYARSLYHYQQAFDKAEAAKDRVLMANAMLRSMETFIELGSFDAALQYLFKAEAVFQKYNYEGFRSVTNSLFGIGQFFHRAGYYQLSVQYFEKALVFNDLHDDAYSVMHAYNTLGLSYLRLKNYQKAVEVFQISNQMAREMGDTGWEALTYGNIGMVYYEQKEYTRAEEHLQYDIETSTQVNGWASACNAAVLMAEMYLEMGLPDKSLVFIELAQSFEDKEPALYLKQFIVDIRTNYYRQKGKYQQAFESKLMLDSLTALVEEKELNQTRSQSEKEHLYALQQAELEAEIANESVLADLMAWKKVTLLLAILLLLMATAAWFLLRRTRKVQALVLDELQMQMQHKELAHLRKLLAYYVNQLQKHPNLGLTEPAGWREQLRELMNRCYNQYFIRHKTSFPALTETDIVLMALAKLKFSKEEIAVLGTTMGLTDLALWQEQMVKKMGGMSEKEFWTDLAEM